MCDLLSHHLVIKEISTTLGNAASSVAVVDVFLVRAQVGATRGTEAILLHWQYYSAYKNIQ